MNITAERREEIENRRLNKGNLARSVRGFGTFFFIVSILAAVVCTMLLIAAIGDGTYMWAVYLLCSVVALIQGVFLRNLLHLIADIAVKILN